ncbi:MAG: TonB-dependent receptor [Williamsia sp.]|nr:TonB-dependent receptor [Williamsia sp.]
MKRNFIVAALIFSSPLFAQQDSVYKTLDQVVVTAGKFPQKQSTTGKVITVISKAELEKNSGRTLGQLLNEQAGITIGGALNNLGVNQAIYTRGASSGRTLILLDGVPVYDPSQITNEFDLNFLSINNIESIEICRGAQSTLYGSDAVAGVINIITTNNSAAKPLNAKATFSAGSYNTFKTNLQLFGKTGKLTYNARYAKLVTDGFSAAYDSSHRKNFDQDGYNGDVASANAIYQLSSSLAIRGFIQYSRYKTDVDAGIFADEKDFYIRNKNLITGTGIRFIKNGVQLTANYQYSDITRNYHNDSLDRPGFSKFSTDDYYGKTQFAEAYASIELGSGFSLLQGADYRFSSMNNQYLSISSFGPFKTAFRDTVHSQASLYSSLYYGSRNKKLHAELGGRINVHSKYGSNSTFTFNPSYALVDSSLRVFGSLATGFKAPTLYQLYSAYGNPNLKPEWSRTYELGLQQQATMISNRIVLFHRKVYDGLDYNYLINRYFNINRQTVRGLEIESSFRPVKAASISVNYTYLHPAEQSQSRVTYKDTTYDHLLRRPQHNLNLNVDYQFRNLLYFRVGAKWVSKRYDVGGYKQPDVPLDSYFILNAYAEWKVIKQVKLFADAQNLTNKRFFDIRGYNSIPFLLNGGVTISL